MLSSLHPLGPWQLASNHRIDLRLKSIERPATPLASHLFEGGDSCFDSETVETSVVDAVPDRLVCLSN